MVRSGVSFNAAKDIPSLAGKVILITGGNAGVGKQTALDLCKHNPSQIWVASRTAATGNSTVDEIQKAAPGVTARFLELDLSSFDSIKKAASTVLASVPRLDIAILNAGVMGGAPAVTKDGYERIFGTNHVGHALLLRLLTPLLTKSSSNPAGSDVRVVIVSSRGHAFGPKAGILFDTLKTATSSVNIMDRYCQSKMANLVYARSMAKHFPQFTTVSVNPGDINTGLYQGGGLGLKMNILTTVLLPFISSSVEDGAKNSLWAATSKEVKSGEYYEPVGASGKGSSKSQDDALAEQLWKWTEEELQGHDV
jgi:retinol dehydrogenase-12